MVKLLILLVSVVGFAAAGVLNSRSVKLDPTNLINQWSENEQLIGLSSGDLLRQRFLLKVLDHVHQPILDKELLEISNAFVNDQSQYKGGLNEDMLYVIDLGLNLRLLNKNELFTVSNPEHMRQMVGLQQLFVRSRDFETFQKNVSYARKVVNGVLFVNALLLSLRERDDTRTLVVPGLHEILPELYFDKNIVNTARNIDLSLLAQSTDSETFRPNLLDMIGLGSRNSIFGMQKNLDEGVRTRSQLWMPWREVRMQMAVKKPKNKNFIKSDIEDKLIIPVQKNNDLIQNKDLLLEDVGLKSFLHLMINDLCLREIELKNMRFGRLGVERNLGLTILDPEELTNNYDNWNRKGISGRWISRKSIKNGREVLNLQDKNRLRDFNLLRQDQIIRGARKEWQDQYRNSLNGKPINSETLDVLKNLPTTNINDPRLLHINRKKLSSIDKINQVYDEGQSSLQDPFSNIIRGSRVNDIRGMVNKNDDNPEFSAYEQLIRDRESSPSRSRFSFDREDDDFMQRFKGKEQLPITGIDNERLLHVNRRRLFGVNNDESEKDESMEYSKNMNKNRYGMLSSQIYQKNYLPYSDIDESGVLYVNDRRLGQNNDYEFNKNIQGQRGRISDMRSVKNDNVWFQGNEVANKGQIDKERRLGVLKTTAENDRLLHLNRRHFYLNDLDNDDLDNARHRGVRDTRSLTKNFIRGVKGREPSSDVLLHNIKQILARLEVNLISQGLNSKLGSSLFGQSRELNEFQNNQLENGLSIEVENSIQRLLDQVIVQGYANEPIEVDGKIADILLGQGGNVNIMNIIRDMTFNTGFNSNNEQSLEDLGIDLENSLLQALLKRLNGAADLERTKLLGSYTLNDLVLEGVTINDVTVDHLKTFVDENDVDILNLLDNRVSLGNTGHKIIVARQQRLNHKDFSIKIDLTSDRSRRVLVRTMLGPKLEDQMGGELSLDKRRNQFLLIDTNVVDLQAGRNVFKQKSKDISWTARDTTPLTKIYESVMMKLDNPMNVDNVLSPVDINGQNCRFPHRLLLPKGRMDGLKMELLVIVTPLENNLTIRDDISCAMGVSTTLSDGNSIGFPLDRRIDNIEEWMTLPNLQVVDVIIRHDNLKSNF